MARILEKFLERTRRLAAAPDEEPIREELYSVERLEQYAATLAAEHRTAEKSRRGRRLPAYLFCRARPHRTHRQPPRLRNVKTVHPRLPTGHAPDHRRVVGRR